MDIGIAENILIVAKWSAANLFIMLALALNTFRMRLKEMIPVGTTSGSPKLERAVRAHGNNTEYVPSILFGILILAFIGAPPLSLHAYGFLLTLSRILHAIGIQQFHSVAPPARVIGNFMCWGVFLTLIIHIVALVLQQH